jgi:hypothetical protein
MVIWVLICSVYNPFTRSPQLPLGAASMAKDLKQKQSNDTPNNDTQKP